jgi:hypothetical protein
MLLEDQLFDLSSHAVSPHLETIKQAYRQIKTEIEHSLEATLRSHSAALY